MRLPSLGAPPGVSGAALASMIDIIFLLIIFFVVTASFDREQFDPAVTPPSVELAAVKSPPPSRLTLNILADGSARVGFHQLAAADIPGALPDILRRLGSGEDTVLIINGDRDTPHKFIAAALEAAAAAGYRQVRVNAEVAAAAGEGR